MIQIIKIAVLVTFFILGRADRKTQEIPIGGIIPFGLFCVVGAMLQMQSGTGTFWDIFLGAAVGLSVLLCSILGKEQIGTGDGILLLLLGIFCGRKVLWVLWLASLTGSAKAIYLLITKKGSKKTRFAFVPALGVGYAVSLLF